MSADLETRLHEAFAARATTTTTAPDAWARVSRRVERRDHRRSVALRSVAAAVIAVLVVGGGVALWGRNESSNTVATSKADGSAASSARSSTEEAAPAVGVRAPRVEQRADGSVVVSLGDAELVLGPAVSMLPATIQARLVGDVVFGAVPKTTTTVTIAPDSGTVELFDDPALPADRVFVARSVPAGVQSVHVEARGPIGPVIGLGDITRG
jgi:hypothetical protein